MYKLMQISSTCIISLKAIKMNCSVSLSDILTENQVSNILNEVLISDYQLVSYDISYASNGLMGFLGDHYRIKLYVQRRKIPMEIHLFVKKVSMTNKPKADFIKKNKFYLRESLMYKYIVESGAAEDENPWCAKAYIHNEDILVMPDISLEGYKLRPISEYLDLDHVLVAVRSLANFHATLTKLFVRKSLTLSQKGALLLEIENAITEPTFNDSPWLRASAKLTVNFLEEFSDKQLHLPMDLEQQIFKLFLQACTDLEEHPNTLNLLIHKDLWVNNIMFKYQDNTPSNAILIDYQCSRYAPPAFDLMSFMYLTTSRSFREEQETNILNYYFSVFTEHLDDMAKDVLRDLGYNLDSFLTLCEMARKFGMVETIGIFPYVLMEPQVAQITFDDPKTYQKYLEEDRSEPVLAHAYQCQYYRDKQLEVIEEFVERYLDL